MKYYIHIPLPQELKDKVLTARRKFGSKSNLEPHITLVDPREILTSIAPADLCHALKVAASGISRFSIVPQGMGDFPNPRFFNDKDVIYIGIKKTIDLLHLHSTISESVKYVLWPSTSEFKNYNPHITLIEGLYVEGKLRAWNALKDRIFFDHFTCERITLLSKIRSGKPWTVVDNFPLT